ncbi:MAG: aldehyde dehydrogenase (NADP(+)) [Cyclobacteriaceae bacterium]|nr:aldehyde dehydrogenase (NADP(+)) [Cyclobacteriaceae bacterium]
MIEGKQIIGFEMVAEGSASFHSFNPATGEKLHYQFTKATPGEVNKAAEKAAGAFQVYRKKSGAEKAIFLETIANEINALGDELVDLCCQETALPKGRIEGERARTVNQLKLFASLLREGSWVDARIETADATRTPLPKPDIRYMEIGLGPVVVFGASNFPLAFSVAGGDTASALAAGCPVIVKVHSAHPATGELVGRAILKAAQVCNMPDGVFSLLHGDGKDVGIQLVKHPAVKAVGLTGSFTAGKALFDAAVSREVPIPVYAEMGSTNPVFILPEAMRERAATIAAGFSASVTLGVGQFCTNPGILIHEKNDGAKEFTKSLEEEFKKTSGGVMLTETIFKSYANGLAHHTNVAGMDVLALGAEVTQNFGARPILFKTTAETFENVTALSEEIFGPTSLVVEAESKEGILSIARNLGGHLTATVHGTENDLIGFKDLIDILEQKVGRVVINGFPTGVEVCHAMVHGGPYPATTDGRSTSVGTAAIHRFTRPVCYQGMPDDLLPAELQNKNPLNIWRLVNGQHTQK